MIALLIALALLSLAAVVATGVVTLRDGYRKVPAIQR